MKETASPSKLPKSSDLLIALTGLIVTGMFVIIFYALSKSVSCCSVSHAGLRVLAVSSGIALAALLVGGLMGFLFSIPRSGAKDKNAAYSDNSNLEDISDWLTKILVGAGLVTLTKIPSKLGALAEWLGNNGFTHEKDGAVFALALMIFFVTCGFLWMYVWTRLYFLRDLIDARSQNDALMNAINESPVANLLLRALSLPPANQDEDSKALRQQAKFMAETQLSEHPESRKIAIQYSRLLEEQFQEPEDAIRILRKTLEVRRKNNLPFDTDDVALNFNVACYLNRKAKAEADVVKKNELRSDAVKLLREAAQTDPNVKVEMKDDDDLKDLEL